jgi:hypothetical protein
MARTMSVAGQLMRADARALVGAESDLAVLLGTWVNAKKDTEHVARVTLAAEDGQLLVRLFGSAAGELVDWGETEATPYMFTGTAEVAGFHARYQLDAMRIEIAANVKQGILVIQTYTEFLDGSGRLCQFSREFFYRSTADTYGGEVPAGTRFLLGDWVNTMPDTQWVKEFTLAEGTDGFRLRIRGAGDPADWGEVEADTYLDKAGDPAFHARYDLDTRHVELAGNTGKNIIILEAFVRFAGGDRPNAFSREFFVPR